MFYAECCERKTSDLILIRYMSGELRPKQSVYFAKQLLLTVPRR